MTTSSDIRVTRRWIAIGALCSVAGSGVFVWTSTHLREGQRQENCDRTYQAIRGFAQKLGEEFGAEQSQIDQFVKELKPIRDECS